MGGPPQPSPTITTKPSNLLSSFKTRLKLKTKQQELLIRFTILCLIYILAFITRLFSVLRYESMIHEFDPYFNYRTTLFLTKNGFYEFWNWFDSESWYPLGRIIGGTLYPGLMVTAAFIYWTLRFLRFAIHIREVCVLTAPFFASNTTIVAYFFGKEIWDSGAGLVAAAFIAICPGYISRSVAGSYDNEGVAIFALLFTFYLFVKAVNTGSLAWSLASAFGYFYMVSAWGGYVFIINLIPLYVLVLLITGRYSMRLYVAYNCMYVLGMLLAMQIQFVGFQHVQSGEHMAAMGVFFLMQVFYFLDWVKHLLSDTKLFQDFLRITLTFTIGLGGLAFGLGMASGFISPWTGRFYSLLDPTYAKDHIPIIASVSEHQPTAWSAFMFDFHILLFLFPAGLYFCFKQLSDTTIFIVMYGLTSMYFASVMVRLILVATPAVCLISAVAVSATIKNLTSLIRTKCKTLQTTLNKGTAGAKASSKTANDQSPPFGKNVAGVLLLGAFYLLSRYATHCTWVTSEAYSSPSIVLAARGANGGRVIFDDYREAYFWLRQNTPPDAKVMSWWDYGYQITAMGNRTVIVDNNTWNNTHIATVGRAMSSSEDEAYEIMQSLDVDYVLVVFGGVTGYSSDDINKSFQNLVSTVDPDTLAALSGGSVEGMSPDMMKTAANMIGKMPPDELQKMLQMASSFQGKNPLFPAGSGSAGQSLKPGTLPEGMSPDMLKTASDMMNKMPPEELQKMFEIASNLRGTDSSKASGGGGIPAVNRNTDTGESSSSRGLFSNSMSDPSPLNLPTSSADLQQQMRNQMNDPAMRQMFSSMIKNMSPDMMANMSEQFGVKMSKEEAAKAQQAMSSLSPDALDSMMRWADRIQRGADKAKMTKNWLLGRPGMILAVCMLILAIILHRLGFIGS